ncbi:hypothetical protein EDD15DRAFT_893116 [Pisolithus albus]|nr:hypothetical protein EDD15DRAFT_893116 [Pisolithus albus]
MIFLHLAPSPCRILPGHSLKDPMHHPQGISPSASFVVASSVLFVYDYTLTIAEEIDLFWLQPRQTWAFAFFIANRYIGLFSRIPEFFGIFVNGSDRAVCSGLLFTNRATTAVLQLIGAVIMGARWQWSL